MINVSSATKSAYQVASVRTLKVSFPDLNLVIDPRRIVEESFSLKEKLETSKYLTFTGCICSQMSLVFMNMTTSLKGQKVEVSIKAGNTDEIPLFVGVVDSQKVIDYDEGRCEIKAYDELYTKGQTDIANWYKSLTYPITLKEYRESLFAYLGLDYVDTELMNDDVAIEKQYSPATMKALDSIRALCQLNGVFGIMNRYGEFEFRTISPIDTGETYDEVAFCKNIDYQRYVVKAITKVIVRQNSNDDGAFFGAGNSVYVVQGNIFTLNLEEEVLSQIAENLYGMVAGMEYIPYTGESYAMPWVECGDIVKYHVYNYRDDTYTDFYAPVFGRSMKGIQAPMDIFTADGEEFQSVFISDLRIQITTLQTQIESIQGKLDAVEFKCMMFYNMDAVDIEDGDLTPVASAEFTVAKKGQMYFELEYLIDVETTETTENGVITNEDLVLTVRYEYDGQVIDVRQPKATYQDGQHILHCFYPFVADAITTHSWRVWINCLGGRIHINLLEAQNMIMGLNIVGDTMWDGNVKVVDHIPALPFNPEVVELEEVVALDIQPPLPFIATELMSALPFAPVAEMDADNVALTAPCMVFTTVVNEPLLTYDATITSNYFTNGSVITPTLYDMTSLDSYDNATCYYSFSFDDGATWYAYSNVTQDWALNTYNSASQLPNIPSSAFTPYLSSGVMIRAIAEDTSSRLYSINAYGAHI